MPYAPDHKARTRARIVESARVLFNRHGFEPVSIDQIMREAGLTRGGFYHHFRSKDELYVEAVRSFATCNPFAKRRRAVPRDEKASARTLVELYLSDEVLNDAALHCPLFALPSDVARAGLEPRQAYTDIVRTMLHVFRSAFPPNDPERHSKAEVILNLCVGGMVVARATNDPALRRSLRAAARAQALSLLGRERRRTRMPTRTRSIGKPDAR